MTVNRDALTDAVLSSREIPEEYAPLLGAVIASADEGSLAGLVQDGMRVKEMMEAGDTEGAAAIMRQYKEMADAAGFGPLFDTMFEEFLHPELKHPEPTQREKNTWTMGV